MRMRHNVASLEDWAFLGVGVLVIATSAVSLYYGVATYLEAPEFQLAAAATLRQEKPATRPAKEEVKAPPCADCLTHAPAR